VPAGQLISRGASLRRATRRSQGHTPILVKGCRGDWSSLEALSKRRRRETSYICMCTHKHACINGRTEYGWQNNPILFHLTCLFPYFPFLFSADETTLEFSLTRPFATACAREDISKQRLHGSDISGIGIRPEREAWRDRMQEADARVAKTSRVIVAARRKRPRTRARDGKNV